MNAKVTVISDLDGTLRYDKAPLAPCLIQEMRGAWAHTDMLFIALTGGTVDHLPSLPFPYVGCAESGAVIKHNGRLVTNPHARQAIAAFKNVFESEDVLDGPMELPEGDFIWEGIRHATITLLRGSPPHYPVTVSGSLESLKLRIEHIIMSTLTPRGLSLACIPGHSATYEWLDIVPVTKEDTVVQLMQALGFTKAYYLGDGRNDLNAMRLPEITPVAFSNSIPEIIALAQQSGIFIDLPGPAGGAEKFFHDYIH